MKLEQVKVNSERWFDLTPLLNEQLGNISLCCNGKRKSYKEYIWRFESEVD